MRNAVTAAFFAAAALWAAACEESKQAPLPAPPIVDRPALVTDAAAPVPTLTPTPTTPAPTPAAEAEILIGEVGPLTGAQATFGDSTHKGIELAVRLVNERGGVKGQKLRVRLVDDKGKPELAAAAVEQLASESKVALVLGEATSAPSIAMAEVAEKLKVPMISHAATSPKVTEGHAYVFRVCFTDPFQGLVMAKFVREKLSLTKVAVLKDAKNDYSTGLAQSFVARFKAAGGKVLKEETYNAGDLDFRVQLTSIKAAGAEAIYVPGYYGDVAQVARQAKAMGLSTPLLGGDGWSSEKLTAVGGAAIEGSYFSDHYSTQDPSPRTQEFVAEYRAAYGGSEPDSFAALGYDALRVAANALARAKSLSADDLRDAIASTRDFEGVTGSITIDGKHDAAKPAVVLKVQGGKPVYQTTVAP
ncbi:MAG TPA: ABC transporter substrate-binding protein [Myxococcales bacterium]